MGAVRKIGEVYLGSQTGPQRETVAELWDFSEANIDGEERQKAIVELVGEEHIADTLLQNPTLAQKVGLPMEVLEFIRFGGDLGINYSLRYNPELPYDSLKDAEREKEIAKHQEEVATFRLEIPNFVYWDLKLASSGVSFYDSLLLAKEKPCFWEPDGGLAIHFIYKNESDRQWQTFQKLMSLEIPPKKAETVLGANILREVWLQGNYEATHCLLGTRDFYYPQTFELVAVMFGLLQSHQRSFAQVKEPGLFVH